MSNKDLQALLSAEKIAGLDLKNRVILAAMDMNLCVEGEISDGEIAHYTARAHGGTAMVITGAGAVSWPIGATSRHQPGFSEDRFIPGIARLANSVHMAGSKLCMQLVHHGKTAGVDTVEGRPQLVPSPMVGMQDLSALRDSPMSELSKLATATQGKKATYKIAEEDDLMWVIGQFVQAARRVQRAGADAIEIHAGHGYLLSTFLSRGYNKRADRWGGSLENRARLTCEVVQAVKIEVGKDFPVLVRVNGCEYGLHDGLTAEETGRAAALIEQAGADAIHVSANAHNPFTEFTQGPLPAAGGQYRQFAKTVKQHVTIPVIAVGRISPEVADEMIAKGECDFVAMGRQLLADPELVNKLKTGRRQSVRPCINCYVCVEQNFFDATPKCAVNPALGNESLAVLVPISTKKHVLIIGAGPGGMEAARVAAERGAKVTLLEKGSRLGGTLWFSQLTTPANEQLVQWLTHEITRLGVNVRLNELATVDTIIALNPDEVIVATGARRGRPKVPGADLPHVLTGDVLQGLITGEGSRDTSSLNTFGQLAITAGRATKILDRASRIRALSKKWMPVGKYVVVIGGGLVGLELAEFLAERGRQVTVLEESPHMGHPMAMPRRWTAVRRATSLGVTLIRGAAVVSVNKVSVRYRIADEEFEVRGETVVLAGDVTADRTLFESLLEVGIKAHIVGDAMEVAYIEGAIHTANRVARDL